MRKTISACLVFALISVLLGGCGSSKDSAKAKEKVFNYGTVAYGAWHDNAGLNPHSGYSGWSTVRYGVGETLFRFNDKLQPEPWLATEYKQVDPRTVKITIRDGVLFTSGRKLDGQAVKECLEDLIENHDRASGDLQLSSITADGQTVTLVSSQPSPVLINYLCDPYGAIIDMKAGIGRDKNVAGTGPFEAKHVTDTEVNLVKNKNYWNGVAKVDKVNVKAITDGDTMTMALQSGDIDATQGLPYSSLDLFAKNDKYKITSTATSRVFMAAMNYRTPVLQDLRVRKAIAMAFDKENFTKVLLRGNGTVAVGPFPAALTLGKVKLHDYPFDLAAAKELLTEAGWSDSNGDGYVDKNGQDLVLRYLTYPGRMELPLLAENVQANLKKLGIKIIVNSTANHRDFLKGGQWDIYASALVTAPTGDPEYFFTTAALDKSAYNRGKYSNPQVEALGRQLMHEFNKEKRGELAGEMSQIIIDDAAFVFASHLKMSFVMKKGVTGFTPHASDYYEITNKLDIN